MDNMDQVKINQIFEKFQQHHRNPSTELIYNSNFELLIAVILSARATDISVNKVTKKLFAVANSPELIVKLGLDKLKSYIRNIGLYNSKANNIIKTCNILIADYNSKVPNIRSSLERLPGVGRKTANVILNTAFNQPVIAIDTHVFRVAQRIGLACGKNLKDIENQLLNIIPDKFIKHAHHWLVLHGRYICKARKPLCSKCIVQDLCQYNKYIKNNIED